MMKLNKMSRDRAHIYYLHNKYLPRCRHAQQGVVLFIALMSLVVMSLAAVALIRSVDTNSQITGNLAFRQTATISSSYGIESMADTLGAQPFVNANTSDRPNGYYAVCNDPILGAADCSSANLTLDSTWVPGTTSRLATGVGISTGTPGIDAFGNTVQYIVERMCNTAGAPTPASCLLAAVGSDPGGPPCHYPSCAPETLNNTPIYRVTVRVSGPKNTVNYIQAFLS